MELLYNFTFVNFYFKISFILFLFLLNLYLILTFNKEIDNKEQQSGFGNKNLKSFLSSLIYFGGFLSTLITVKNEVKDYQIGKLEQIQETERDNIRRSIDKDKEEHQNLLNSMENNREELLKLYGTKTKLIAQNDRLLNIHSNIKENIISFKEKSTQGNIKLSELGIIDQLIHQDAKKFSEELTSVLLQIDPTTFSSNSSNSDTNISTYSKNSNTEEIKESNIFPINLSYYLEQFETLNGIKKLAVTLIISKSVVFSALISIIFIFYGNILIEKYDIENNYPKLARIIQLRQKFQNYYFKYYCLLIFFVIITEISFSIAILSINP